MPTNIFGFGLGVKVESDPEKGWDSIHRPIRCRMKRYWIRLRERNINKSLHFSLLKRAWPRQEKNRISNMRCRIQDYTISRKTVLIITTCNTQSIAKSDGLYDSRIFVGWDFTSHRNLGVM
nr:hypothetical protein [Desulfobacterales bacterium]